MIASWKESYDNPRWCIKKQRHHLAGKGLYSHGYGLSSIHVRMWELDHKGRTPKNSCFWTVVLEKTLQNPLDRRSNLSILREINSEYSNGKTDAEAEAPVFWSSDVNRWLFGKVLDAGKDWGLKEKRASEDKMVGRHHRYNEHELGQTPGDGEWQGGLVCCNPWHCKESDMTCWLNSNNNKKQY